MDDELDVFDEVLAGKRFDVEPEPVFDEIKTHEIESKPVREVSLSKDKIISDIVDRAKQSHSQYIQSVPNWRSFEEFLRSFPESEIDAIRQHFIDRGVYGNVPLEELVMTQFGIVTQSRMLDQATDRSIERIRAAVFDGLLELRQGQEKIVEESLNRFEKITGRMNRTISDAHETFQSSNHNN